MAKKFVDIGTQSTLDKVVESTNQGFGVNPIIKQQYDGLNYTINIFLVEGNTMLCDTSKFILMDGEVTPCDNGYNATGTGTCVFSLSKKFINEPYTII